jgi:D-alanine transfer protein
MAASSSSSSAPRLPHLTAAIIALILWCLIAMLIAPASRRAARTSADRLGRVASIAATPSVVAARAALDRPDLLSIYGSSEMARPSRNRAPEFFARFPTGFAVFAVGGRGTPLLISLQQLASVAPELRDRKVALVVSPSIFTLGGPSEDRLRPLSRRKRHAIYAGNFSRLEAGELVFGRRISGEVKRLAARRLLEFPEVLDEDPFLRGALETLAAGGLRHVLLRPAFQALGRIQTAVLETGDDLRMLALLARRADLRSPTRPAPTVLDFAALRRSAESEYRTRVAGHAFGFLPKMWADSSRWQRQKGQMSDERFLDFLRSSPYWADLDLLLRFLHQSGAHPLVVSLPYAAEYMDFWGVTRPARQEYYRRVRTLAAGYGIRCETLEGHEYDPYFLSDPYHHPAPVGWITIDSVLNAFYHETSH